MLDKGYNFTQIGKAIEKDRTTVSKEIKRNRYIKSYHFDAFDSNGINIAVSRSNILQKPPYVCNQCKSKNKWNKHKLYYNAFLAQGYYEEKQFDSRLGVNITPQIVDQIEKNHEYIRKIFPKDTSFDSFSNEKIQKLENIINNIPKNSLDNKTPYQLTKEKYPELINKLHIDHISPDDISLNPKDF